MHETPKGMDVSQDQQRNQGADRQQKREPDGASKSVDGDTGMDEDEASGAGYGNNAGQQGGNA